MLKFKFETIVRGVIVVVAILIILITFGMSFLITNEVKQQEKDRIQWYAMAQELILSAPEESLEICDFTLHSKIQESNTSIPIILTEADFRIIDIMNYENRNLARDRKFFEERVEALKLDSHFVKIEVEGFIQYLFYDDSQMLLKVKRFPYYVLGGIVAFLVILIFYVLSLKRREQERIWVGMAKETAHQLGTPISSLIGWVDNLKTTYEEDNYIHMVADEIGKDIRLLEIVTERFSKIGAVPELQLTNVVENLTRYHNYIKQRASRKIEFDFPNTEDTSPVYAKINSLLFDWVLENLLKNALDAMETGQGMIKVKAYEDAHWVVIQISDTGKGMTPQLQKRIFEPGYSTKKRGWGLGLSLCRRIIEQYHKGRIFVYESTPGKGTTFRILLPAPDMKKAVALKGD